MGYMVMLVVMTFNIGFIFTAIFAQAAAHFCWQSVVDDDAGGNTLDGSVEPECCEK